MVHEVLAVIRACGWKNMGQEVAGTGSVYIDICRSKNGQNEWAVVRVSDHKQVYQHWLTVLPVSRYELDLEHLALELKREFGKVGDIL